MFTNLVCAECGDTNISVECVVVQDSDGELEITSICDDGHTCNVCGGDHITERLTKDAAMKEIQTILDRKEWSAETSEQIATVVRRTGLSVREPLVDEPDEEPTRPEDIGSPVDTTQCQTNDWCTLPEGHLAPCRDVEGRELAFGPRYGARDAS